jgi:uncharacterized LabA/DUF88 family protein
MEVLVDYSNLRHAERAKGPTYVIDRVVTALGLPHLGPYSRVTFRLYDGWYENQTLTRRAQDASAEILRDFPLTKTLTDGLSTKAIVVNAELAYSLKIDPGTHLWHTFRLKGAPWNLSCAHPAAVGCTTSPCDLAFTHSFFLNNKCPNVLCKLTPSNLIARSEQKLVDTMIAADLYYLHLQKTPIVALVSSDDDMWPTIKTALDLGMHVIQVHTVPGHTTPSFYTRGPRPSYTEIHM